MNFLLQYCPLTKPQKSIKQHYNVVVIGSGYGGAVAACRSARAGQSVCVFEKGLEWLPGDFPETMEDSFRSTHVSGEVPKKSFGEFEVTNCLSIHFHPVPFAMCRVS